MIGKKETVVDWFYLTAHGVFGSFDEVIFAVVGGAFLGLLALTWWRSRNATHPEIPPHSDTENSEPAGTPTAGPDHFKVD